MESIVYSLDAAEDNWSFDRTQPTLTKSSQPRTRASSVMTAAMETAMTSRNSMMRHLRDLVIATRTFSVDIVFTFSTHFYFLYKKYFINKPLPLLVKRFFFIMYVHLNIHFSQKRIAIRILHCENLSIELLSETKTKKGISVQDFALSLSSWVRSERRLTETL